MIQNGAGRVAGGVASGDELRQSFSGKLFTTELLSLLVTTFHEAGQKVDSVGGVVQSLVDSSNGNPGQVLDGLDAVGEKRVWKVFGIGLELREAAKGTVLC